MVHRNNLDRLDRMIAMAEELNADKLEIANVQYYGWALRNRRNLLPTREQLRASLASIASAQERLRGNMRLDYVLPDYYAKFPKPCMGGWGRSLMLMDPAGFCMPCHAAGAIAGMRFDSCARSLHRVDLDAVGSVHAFFAGRTGCRSRGRSCDRRELDFGGCRCQAFSPDRRRRRHRSGMLPFPASRHGRRHSAGSAGAAAVKFDQRQRSCIPP